MGDALRPFRDSHLRIVALYIIGPSRRGPSRRAPTSADVPRAEVAAAAAAAEVRAGKIGTGGAAAVPGLLRGTGGADLVKFLKGVRDRIIARLKPLFGGLWRTVIFIYEHDSFIALYYTVVNTTPCV
jgi:indoleamine 2,3-dioxygenase